MLLKNAAKENATGILGYFDGQRCGMPHAQFIALIALGFFFEQWDIYNFGYTAPAISKFWGLGMSWVGNTNAVGQIGMTAGALLGGWLSDKVGRKIGFLTATIFYGIATVLCGAAPNPVFFMVSRFLAMLGTVALAVITMVYIAEMVPADKRGKWELRVLGTGMLALPLSGLFAKWVVSLSPEGWRWQYYWGGGFALIEAILVYLWCNESPRWLVSKGKGAEAGAILKRMLPRVTFDPSAIAAAVNQRQGAPRLATLKALKKMWNSFYRRRTILLFIMAIIGSNTTGTFAGMMPTFFKAQGLSMGDSLLLVSVMSWGAPVGVIFASFSLDKGGRKIPMALFGIVEAALIVTLAFVKGFAPMAIVGVALYMSMNMYFFASQVYTAESFGTNIRNTATGAVIGTGRFATAIWMVFIASMYSALKFSGFLTMMAGCLFALMIGVLLFGHRTSKRSLEEIAGEGMTIASAKQ